QVPGSFRFWVNVSPHQLINPRFGDQVAELLAEHDVAPSMLGLEIAEEVLRDVQATGKVLRALRRTGISVNLDDFGASHSNLSWLQELPISGLKIDKRFVSHLDETDGGRRTAIVRGLVGLGHALGLSLVAEGVETATQAEILHEMGCELAQGYYFAYPGTPEQLWALVNGSPSLFSDDVFTSSEEVFKTDVADDPKQSKPNSPWES
ncbi:MAG: EAL domain-containing protein, partial [Acidimicrobiales bacterium]